MEDFERVSSAGPCVVPLTLEFWRVAPTGRLVRHFATIPFLDDLNLSKEEVWRWAIHLWSVTCKFARAIAAGRDVTTVTVDDAADSEAITSLDFDQIGLQLTSGGDSTVYTALGPFLEGLETATSKSASGLFATVMIHGTFVPTAVSMAGASKVGNAVSKLTRGRKQHAPAEQGVSDFRPFGEDDQITVARVYETLHLRAHSSRTVMRTPLADSLGASRSKRSSPTMQSPTLAQEGAELQRSMHSREFRPMASVRETPVCRSTSPSRAGSVHVYGSQRQEIMSRSGSVAQVHRARTSTPLSFAGEPLPKQATRTAVARCSWDCISTSAYGCQSMHDSITATDELHCHEVVWWSSKTAMQVGWYDAITGTATTVLSRLSPTLGHFEPSCVQAARNCVVLVDAEDGSIIMLPVQAAHMSQDWEPVHVAGVVRLQPASAAASVAIRVDAEANCTSIYAIGHPIQSDVTGQHSCSLSWWDMGQGGPFTHVQQCLPHSCALLLPPVDRAHERWQARVTAVLIGESSWVWIGFALHNEVLNISKGCLAAYNIQASIIEPTIEVLPSWTQLGLGHVHSLSAGAKPHHVLAVLGPTGGSLQRRIVELEIDAAVESHPIRRGKLLATGSYDMCGWCKPVDYASNNLPMLACLCQETSLTGMPTSSVGPPLRASLTSLAPVPAPTPPAEATAHSQVVESPPNRPSPDDIARSGLRAGENFGSKLLSFAAPETHPWHRKSLPVASLMFIVPEGVAAPDQTARVPSWLAVTQDSEAHWSAAGHIARALIRRRVSKAVPASAQAFVAATSIQPSPPITNKPHSSSLATGKTRDMTLDGKILEFDNGSALQLADKGVEDPIQSGKTVTAGDAPSWQAGVLKEAESSLVQATNVRVLVRLRPMLPQDITRGGKVAVHATNRTTVVVDAPAESGRHSHPNEFAFERVFPPTADQAQIYDDAIVDVVTRCVEGFNACVFAYGQTGSGKTFTLEGADHVQAASDMSWLHAGIIPRAVRSVFKNIQATAGRATVTITHVEIYNEDVVDLLRPSAEALGAPTPKHPPILIETEMGEDELFNVTELQVNTLAEVLDILHLSSQARTSHGTMVNDRSSRSHSVFSLAVKIPIARPPPPPQSAASSDSKADDSPAQEQLFTQGTLQLVDLAGSESVKRSGSMGDRHAEASSINRSLLVLGRVIRAVTLGERHVPYRESKLTRVLRRALGGDAFTVMLLNIAPANLDANETLSTLRYAEQAAYVVNQPQRVIFEESPASGSDGGGDDINSEDGEEAGSYPGYSCPSSPLQSPKSHRHRTRVRSRHTRNKQSIGSDSIGMATPVVGPAGGAAYETFIASRSQCISCAPWLPAVPIKHASVSANRAVRAVVSPEDTHSSRVFAGFDAWVRQFALDIEAVELADAALPGLVPDTMGSLSRVPVLANDTMAALMLIVIEANALTRPRSRKSGQGDEQANNTRFAAAELRVMWEQIWTKCCFRVAEREWDGASKDMAIGAVSCNIAQVRSNLKAMRDSCQRQLLEPFQNVTESLGQQTAVPTDDEIWSMIPTGSEWLLARRTAEHVRHDGAASLTVAAMNHAARATLHSTQQASPSTVRMVGRLTARSAFGASGASTISVAQSSAQDPQSKYSAPRVVSKLRHRPLPGLSELIPSQQAVHTLPPVPTMSSASVVSSQHAAVTVTMSKRLHWAVAQIRAAESRCDEWEALQEAFACTSGSLPERVATETASVMLGNWQYKHPQGLPVDSGSSLARTFAAFSLVVSVAPGAAKSVLQPPFNWSVRLKQARRRAQSQARHSARPASATSKSVIGSGSRRPLRSKSSRGSVKTNRHSMGMSSARSSSSSEESAYARASSGRSQHPVSPMTRATRPHGILPPLSIGSGVASGPPTSSQDHVRRGQAPSKSPFRKSQNVGGFAPASSSGRSRQSSLITRVGGTLADVEPGATVVESQAVLRSTAMCIARSVRLKLAAIAKRNGGKPPPPSPLDLAMTPESSDVHVLLALWRASSRNGTHVPRSLCSSALKRPVVLQALSVLLRWSIQPEDWHVAIGCKTLPEVIAWALKPSRS